MLNSAAGNMFFLQIKMAVEAIREDTEVEGVAFSLRFLLDSFIKLSVFSVGLEVPAEFRVREAMALVALLPPACG